MWMDINTKPKQGNVFRVFREHVMGIPADYNDASFATRCNFRPPNWVPEDWVASQECVGEQVTNKEVEIWDQIPAMDRWVRFAVDKEVRAEPTAEPTKQDQRAQIKMVSGRGMVQVWVGQKTHKRNILRAFKMSDYINI
jgi:hypothetical protein